MSSLVKITPVLSTDVDIYWPDAAPLIQKAIDEAAGEFSIHDIYNSLKSQDRALWLVHLDDVLVAAVTVRVDVFPTGLKTCVIDYAGGSHWSAWSHFTDAIEPVYKSLGCARIEIAGRLGWMRLYAARGFKPKYLALHKEIV